MKIKGAGVVSGTGIEAEAWRWPEKSRMQGDLKV